MQLIAADGAEFLTELYGIVTLRAYIFRRIVLFQYRAAGNAPCGFRGIVRSAHRAGIVFITAIRTESRFGREFLTAV